MTEMQDILSLPVEAVRLTNGIRCLMRPQAHNEIVAILALLDITVFDEPDKHPGLATLVQRSLRRGTVKRSNAELALALESLGASLSSSMSQDLALVELQVTRDEMERAIALMAEVMWEPAFQPEEIAKEREQILAEIRLRDDDPFSLTQRHFRRALYGSHPYGRPVEGTAESVPRLNTGLCRQWHRRQFIPANTLLVAVGNFEPRGLVKLLNRHFGKRAAPESETASGGDRLRTLTTYRPRRTSIVRDVEQSISIVGWPAPSIEKMDDAAALRVASAVLGAGMSSRLFQDLRDRQGLAYSVGCSFALRRSTSCLVAHIGTDPEQTAHATRSIVQAVQTLGREPVGEEELTRAKTYLRGAHLSAHQTNSAQAWYLGWGQLTGLGHTFDAQWPALIDAVAAEDVIRAIRRHVTTPTIMTLRPRQQSPR
ncbi:insulinase family protein [Candidatus Sumerlaeota bacterium]|nr:insulinase family protein [Candidatus Sumerlaeota bacterium]